jgi:hypothetical protein
MKQIGETTYYTKQEAAAIIGCSVNTLNARIVKTKTDGYYLGRSKHYTAEQVRSLAEYKAHTNKQQ